MKYDFVCNATTFNSLNEKLANEISTIKNSIATIKDNIDIIIDTDNWEAAESDGIKIRSDALKADLNTCLTVLNDYYLILVEEQTEAKAKIEEIQNDITTEGTLANYYRQQ